MELRLVGILSLALHLSMSGLVWLIVMLKCVPIPEGTTPSISRQKYMISGAVKFLPVWKFHLVDGRMKDQIVFDTVFQQFVDCPSSLCVVVKHSRCSLFNCIVPTSSRELVSAWRLVFVRARTRQQRMTAHVGPVFF